VSLKFFIVRKIATGKKWWRVEKKRRRWTRTQCVSLLLCMRGRMESKEPERIEKVSSKNGGASSKSLFFSQK